MNALELLKCHVCDNNLGRDILPISRNGISGVFAVMDMTKDHQQNSGNSSFVSFGEECITRVFHYIFLSLKQHVLQYWVYNYRLYVVHKGTTINDLGGRRKSKKKSLRGTLQEKKFERHSQGKKIERPCRGKNKF